MWIGLKTGLILTEIVKIKYEIESSKLENRGVDIINPAINVKQKKLDRRTHPEEPANHNPDRIIQLSL